jgi:cephalosporin hydroxylase
MGRLTDIANYHTVDKGTEYYEKHGYTELYSNYIPETGKFTLLEIGVWHGDSLRMWEEYNPELNIHAVDIDPDVLNFMNPSDKSVIHIGDQSDKEFMEDVVVASGAPDFIIDDGSHRYDDIIKAFDILYPKLKSGGYYFIEDLHPSYAERDRVLEYTALYNGELVCNNKLLIIKKP